MLQFILDCDKIELHLRMHGVFLLLRVVAVKLHEEHPMTNCEATFLRI